MSGKTQIFGDQIVSGTITNTQISSTATISASKITPPGSTLQLIYNNAGAFAASANLTFDGTTLSVGTITLNSSTTNMVVPGNITTASRVILQGAQPIQFNQTNNASSITLHAPTSGITSYDLVMPPAQGAAGTSLSNDGAGNLSWAVSGAGSVTQNTYIVGTSSGTYTGSTTLFNLPFTYVQDGKSLQVMYNGQVLVSGADYAETSNTSVTFNSALTVGFTAVFRTITPQNPSNTSVAQFQNYVVGTSSGTYTGSTTVYNLPFAYTQNAKSLEVFYDGVQLIPGDDYTETTSTSITTTQALVSGQKIAFRTISTIGNAAAVTALRENYIVGTSSGNYTGSTTVFNLINSYTPGGINLQVFLDGDLQTVGGTIDYTETNGTTVTFNNALVSGEKVTFLFSQTVAATGTVTTGSANTLAAYNSAGSVIASMGANASAGGFKVTNVANGTSAADAVNLSQLKVLQVGIPVFNSTTTNSTTATWADTSLTASITPSSTSSRILVIVSQQGYVAVNVGNTILDLRIVQGASTVVQTFPCVLSGPTTGSQSGAITSQLFIAAIDSPATTSAVSYKTQLQNQNAASTAATNRTTSGTQPTSMILLIEVV